MENKKDEISLELLKIFEKSPKDFPCGYQRLKRTEVKLIEGRISCSQEHKSSRYVVAFFYKPISNIFNND